MIIFANLSVVSCANSSSDSLLLLVKSMLKLMLEEMFGAWRGSTLKDEEAVHVCIAAALAARFENSLMSPALLGATARVVMSEEMSAA